MLSPTAISTYLYCPRKLFLEKVLKIVQYPKDSMIKGSVKHKIYEDINKAQEELVKKIKSEDSKEDIFSNFKKRYSQIARQVILNNLSKLKSVDVDELELFNNFWNALSKEAESRVNIVYDFIEENKVYQDELWEKLTPKIVCEEWITDSSLQIRGIIDELRNYPDSILPVELKSGSSPTSGVWPGHKLQIACYMVMLQNQGKTVKEGMIKYIDENKEVVIQMNTLLKDEVVKHISLTKEVINSKTIPKHIDSHNKCSACQLKENCYNQEFIDEKLKEKGLMIKG